MMNSQLKIKISKPSMLILSYLLLGVSGISGQAQDFNLFEEVEAGNIEQPAQQRPGRESRVTAAKPEFTLVGTSRIGNRYSVILSDNNNGKIVVSTEPGINVSIPDHSEYQIVAAINGKVSVRYPDSVSCIDFPDSGVRCNSAGNIAELSLPHNPPVTAPQQSTQLIAVQNEQQATAEQVDENPTNPFAIMRARAQNADNTDNPTFIPPDQVGNGRFVPRRIDPSEVPPGSRIVSTPFGDRIVPQ